MKFTLCIVVLFVLGHTVEGNETFETLIASLKALTVQAKAVRSETVTFRDSVHANHIAYGKNWNTNLKPKYKQLRNEFNTKKNEQIKEYEKLTNRSPEVIKLIEDIADNVTAARRKELEDKVKAYETFSENKVEEFQQKLNKINELRKAITGVGAWIDETRVKIQQETAADEKVKQLEEELHLITRQIQNQQFSEEEKTRSDGNSGIKQIRTRYTGAKNYFSSSHSGRSFAAIHDHSNNIRLCGMGEFVGVLNGVEFRTRHNDYALRKPATNDKTFHKVEDIDFPDVPPEVLSKGSVDDQVSEMREWFKAFKNQDHLTRDYRKYFKPVLCYLEGAWTTKNGDSIEEPFESDRHKIDANGWFDLQEKIRFTSYSGTKSREENLAHLPTTIMGFDSRKKPLFAQWNYRILCHPLKNDLPTSYLKLQLDPHAQKMYSWDDERFATTRAARFDIEGIDINGRRKDGPMLYTLLDSLMEEIPGKENYGAYVNATGFDSEILSANPNANGKPLNGATYHRPYKLKDSDAMGVDTAQRGYSDRLYVAMTTQNQVSGPSFTRDEIRKKGRVVQEAAVIKSKVSYAIPLEIIYLTPLAKWNPYDIRYETNKNIKMSGKGTNSNPYVSSDHKTFFHTPFSFFNGGTEADAADTSQSGGVYIKDKKGIKQRTHASGARIMFPKIDGIDGLIRQRYPIMPIYGEGNSLWKKLNAFEDSLSDYKTAIDKEIRYFKTGDSQSDKTTIHSHVIELDTKEINALIKDHTKVLTKTTTHANTHTHVIEIQANDKNELGIIKCDGNVITSSSACFDDHPIKIVRVD